MLDHGYGALPVQTLKKLISIGAIKGVDEDCLQPSSFDLPISDEIYRLRGSLLPNVGEKISDLVKHGSTGDRVRPDDILWRDNVYLCRLDVTLKLLSTIHGKASSKSSTGRIDVRCRLLADGVARFDEIPEGYSGELWLEIVPKSFNIKLKPKMKLNQLRLFCGRPRLNATEHEIGFIQHGFLRAKDGSKLSHEGKTTSKGVLMTVDLTGEVAAYCAKKPWQTLDLSTGDLYPLETFFETIARPEDGEIVLEPGRFYLLPTKERIVIPPMFAAEMVQHDPTIGDLYTHFAGFFDPGFGYRDEKHNVPAGNIAVMEVVVHSNPVILRDGQPICVMAYEQMQSIPDTVYGESIGSNYGVQEGPQAAKFFRRRT